MVRAANPLHVHGDTSEAAYRRFRGRVVDVFTEAGIEPAVQCWYVFSTALLGWLANEQGGPPTDPPPRFEVFLDVLIGGLPPVGDRLGEARTSRRNEE
ncbi:hypothetical protein GCM10029978_090870 [Actinoallomurus acanthiterrae]